MPAPGRRFRTGTASPPLDLAPAATDFHVVFQDDDTISGRTLGFRTENTGLHLYPLNSADRVTHIFVPNEALKHYQIGELMGEALVKNGHVEQAHVDEALEAQKERRSEKIGQLLGRHAVVTAAELELSLRNQMSVPNKKIGEILIDEGLITPEQLEESLSLQKAGKRRQLGEVLISMGLISETDLIEALAQKLGIPRVELRLFVVEPKTFDLIPVDLMEKHNVVPLYQFDGRVAVAMSDPLNVDALRELRFAVDSHIDPVLAESEAIHRLINLMKAVHQVDLDALKLDITEELSKAASSSEVMTYSNDLVVRLVNKIIVGAIYSNASDIHIEGKSRRGQGRVRQRIDGRLSDVLTYPGRLHRAVVSRLKVMAGLDVTETRRPQDGQINLRKFDIAENGLRIATIPTHGGSEDAVMRIIGGPVALNFAGLGLSRRNTERLIDVLDSPSGLILNTGPTGSGKSTTLHALLAYLNSPDKKIWTIEDPVEITQDRLRQVQVAPDQGLSFENALRAIMRLDPDIIMVGEIRDQSTAAVSVSAALTGHMVLSTLHTNGAVESIGRLLDMEVDAYDFADSLRAAMAQRLTRRVCPACGVTRTPTSDEMRELRAEFMHEAVAIGETDTVTADTADMSWNADDYKMIEPVGCDECHQTGFKGLIALHELLVTSSSMKELIHRRATTMELRKEAIRSGMHTLRQDGIEKALSGLTTIHEVRGALGPLSLND